MTTSFVKELQQFALSVDIVNKTVLDQVGGLLKDYFKNSLQANAFEVRVPGKSGARGERNLETLWWSCDDHDGFTAPLYYEDGETIRGHTSYSVLKNKPLWIVSSNRDCLKTAGEYREFWSNVEELPDYRGWEGQIFRTSVIVPLGSPAIGFLNLEFSKYFEPTTFAQEELQAIAKSIEIIYQLFNTHRVQTKNTENAVRSINTRVPRSPLLKATLFFAFSSQADLEVVGIIQSVLANYSERLDIIKWDEMQNSGNIHAQIRNAITTAEYGICYFSQPSSDDNQFVDNPNVIFEAGMFHALTSSSNGQSKWIPIREQNSGAAPFDFAADRIVNVRRAGGRLNRQAFEVEIARRLQELLEN